jgi:hypothetical protein
LESDAGGVRYVLGHVGCEDVTRDTGFVEGATTNLLSEGANFLWRRKEARKREVGGAPGVWAKQARR